MKFHLILSILTALISIQTFANEISNTGLVSVKSTYIHNGRNYSVSGKGIYLAKGSGSYAMLTPQDRHFILTVAHASQGENLEIKIGNESVKILGRLAFSRRDLELIEIEVPSVAKPLAVWNSQLRNFINIFHREGVLLKSDFGDERVRPFYVANEAGDAIDSDGQISYAPYIAVPIDYKNPKAREFNNQFANPADRTLFKNISGRTVIKSKIAPGMSGSPMFSTEVLSRGNVTAVAILVGLASQYAKFQEHSFVTDQSDIHTIFSSYMKGHRKELIEKFQGIDVITKWVHDGQSTVRKIFNLSNGELILLEQGPSLGSAAEGTNGDGTEGTNGDGTEGTNGDGTEGTNGDGGETINKNNSPEKTDFGFLINNKGTRVLKITYKKTKQTIYVQANWSALDFLMKMKSDIIYESIAVPDMKSLFEIRRAQLINYSSGNLVETVELNQTATGWSAVAKKYIAKRGSDIFQLDITSTLMQKRKFVSVLAPSNLLYRIDTDDFATLNLERVKNNRQISNTEGLWKLAFDAYRTFSFSADVVR